MEVVKFLVQSQAQVNSTTKTKSTPLRAACYDGHLDIVRFLVESGADVEIANRHGHTCLMIACYKGHYRIAKYLIRCGANVNRKSVKGNTALHDCAESGSLDIMKLLFDNDAHMEVDSYGVTPLIAAALTGHSHIVELIISTAFCEPRERINALELLGATFVDKKRDMMGALDFWRRSIRERNKFGIHVKRRNSSIASVIANAQMDVLKKSDAIESSNSKNSVNQRPWREVETEAELEDIFSDPDDMRMQALAVRERILGPAHPDTSYYIRYRGAVYADTGNYDKCIQLWMYALNMQQSVLDTLNPMIQSSLLSFAELFSFMMSKSLNKVTFKDVFAVFQRSLRQLQYSSHHQTNSVTVKQTSQERKSIRVCCPASSTLVTPTVIDLQEETNYHRTLVIVLHFVGLMCRLLPLMSSEEELQLRKTVYQLVKLDPKGRNGLTPLHLSCMTDSSYPSLRFPLCEFPMVEMVKLFLEVGADPNKRDGDDSTPLHAVASMLLNVDKSAINSNSNNNANGSSTPVIMASCKTVVDLLLEHGAHIDIRNKKGETALNLLMKSFNADQAVSANILPLKHLSLQCLAAQVIVKNKLSFDSSLSKDLAEFVQSH